MENTVCTLCGNGEETQPHLLSCEALSSHSLVCSDVVPVYEDIYDEDATTVESIGVILLEKFNQFKNIKQNPDAHVIVSNLVNSIVRAATGGNTRGIG